MRGGKANFSWLDGFLRVSLYGLEQAAADRFDMPHSRLMFFDSDLIRSKADPCFYCRVKVGHFFYVRVHSVGHALPTPFNMILMPG